jgi:hypothetical protein
LEVVTDSSCELTYLQAVWAFCFLLFLWCQGEGGDASAPSTELSKHQAEATTRACLKQSMRAVFIQRESKPLQRHFPLVE